MVLFFPLHLDQLPDLIFCAATQIAVPAQSSNCCGVRELVLSGDNVFSYLLKAFMKLQVSAVF